MTRAFGVGHELRRFSGCGNENQLVTALPPLLPGPRSTTSARYTLRVLGSFRPSYSSPRHHHPLLVLR